MGAEIAGGLSPSLAPPGREARGGHVRPMTRDDIPSVARLFARTFRGGRTEAGAELERYIETVFFGSPQYRPESGSIVHDAGSGVTSAVLAIPMEFTAHGRPIVARLLCAFMSEGKEGAAGAAQLARHIRVSRPDMCFSDNSSPVSADHWIAGGGIVLPIQSLEWRRAFRPLTATAIAWSRFVPILRSGAMLGPLGWLDRRLRRRRSSIGAPAVPGCSTATATPGEFLHCAGPMMERFAVRPVWAPQEFDWLVGAATLNRGLGELHFRKVVDAAGRPIGAFLFFGCRGREAVVLNLVCAAGREIDVVGQMFASLDAEGYACARGMSQPFLMNAVSRQRWLHFRHRGYFCLVTRHPEIREAAQRNEIYAGGLASESWSRLLNDF